MLTNILIAFFVIQLSTKNARVDRCREVPLAFPTCIILKINPFYEFDLSFFKLSDPLIARKLIFAHLFYFSPEKYNANPNMPRRNGKNHPRKYHDLDSWQIEALILLG